MAEIVSARSKVDHGAGMDCSLAHTLVSSVYNVAGSVVGCAMRGVQPGSPTCPECTRFLPKISGSEEQGAKRVSQRVQHSLTLSHTGKSSVR